MRLNIYLIVTEDGSASVRKNRPDARVGQIVIPLRLNIPDSVFRPKHAEPIAIDVPEAHIVQPTVESYEPPA